MAEFVRIEKSWCRTGCQYRVFNLHIFITGKFGGVTRLQYMNTAIADISGWKQQGFFNITQFFILKYLSKDIIQKLGKAPYKEKASIEIFTDIIKGLKDMCQGVHLIPVGWEEKLPKFLDAAKL